MPEVPDRVRDDQRYHERHEQRRREPPAPPAPDEEEGTRPLFLPSRKADADVLRQHGGLWQQLVVQQHRLHRHHRQQRTQPMRSPPTTITRADPIRCSSRAGDQQVDDDVDAEAHAVFGDDEGAGENSTRTGLPGDPARLVLLKRSRTPTNRLRVPWKMIVVTVQVAT